LTDRQTNRQTDQTKNITSFFGGGKNTEQTDIRLLPYAYHYGCGQHNKALSLLTTQPNWQPTTLFL